MQNKQMVPLSPETIKAVKREQEENAPEIKMSRKERRDRIRYFATMFKKHLKQKPSVDIHETDPKKQEEKINQMNAWGARYGVLLRKLMTLGYDFEKDGLGIHAARAREAQEYAERLSKNGSVEIGDLQIVPDSITNANDMQSLERGMRVPSKSKGTVKKPKMPKR